MRTTETWKVGPLASATGLTVRTLHHWDEIGLVCPSGRTTSGHRLYEADDVQRLYQVLALRQLGLSLDSIAAVTDGDTSLSEILDAHRAYLDEQLTATRTLRAHVEMLSRRVRTSPDASVADFLEVIKGVTDVDDTVKRYFSESQLADLAERRAELGEDTIAAAESSWQELIPRVNAALSAAWIRRRPKPRRWRRSGWGCSNSSTAVTRDCATACTACTPTTRSGSSRSSAGRVPSRSSSSRRRTRLGRRRTRSV